ncbi:MAG: HAD-IC family P-type ATPase [Candidatus Gottesmanbacteria bacterium]
MYKGLSENETAILKSKFGENSLPAKEATSPLTIFISQFKSPLIYILLIVALISFLFAQYFDSLLIFAVILINVLMSFFQEYNAQKTLAALQQVLKPEVLVIRDGLRKRIEAKYLLPGDLVVLGAGDRIPADGKLIEGTSFLVNEAILTGEEEGVNKTIEDKRNLLFMGTSILFGQGIMEVITIGQTTQVGKIGQSLTEIKEEPTPLQRRLTQFSKSLAKVILGLCFFILIIGVLSGKDFWMMLKTSIILSVAAIPEGLPVAITVILVLGMRKILKKQGLVKKLLSIETLGSTSVICTDKTGTLTEGKMKVVETDFVDQTKGVLALMLANYQRTNIEIAFWDHAQSKKHLLPAEILTSLTKTYEEPFDSEKKYTLVINKMADKETAFMVGAAEIVLNFCRQDSSSTKKIIAMIEDWADRGLKVVGLAFKEDGNLKEKNNFSWLGLVGIEDPLRQEAKEAIITAQKAGIKIKIVTGDLRKTAERIAKNLDLQFSPDQILEGKELETLTDLEINKRINNIVLFTRVTPHQKLKIVEILQARGEVVAMTGDGVNDAPALKKADIGVVVGTGSDVAKEAGDLILLDNNFKTIVSACEEGRLIIANLKKVIGYVLSNSFSEIILIFGAIITQLPTPLTVVQILWIHLICDGPPDILLSFEPKENGLMLQKPKDLKNDIILSRTMKVLILTVSLISGLGSLLVFKYFLQTGNNLTIARTMIFTFLSLVSLVYIFSFKNLHKSVIKTENFFANKYLFLGVLYGLILILAAVYLPFFNLILGTTPLNIKQWLLIISLSLAITVTIELFKLTNIFQEKITRTG